MTIGLEGLGLRTVVKQKTSGQMTKDLLERSANEGKAQQRVMTLIAPLTVKLITMRGKVRWKVNSDCE